MAHNWYFPTISKENVFEQFPNLKGCLNLKDQSDAQICDDFIWAYKKWHIIIVYTKNIAKVNEEPCMWEFEKRLELTELVHSNIDVEPIISFLNAQLPASVREVDDGNDNYKVITSSGMCSPRCMCTYGLIHCGDWKEYN